MSAHWAKLMKTADHLDLRNVCFRGWVEIQTAGSPQVRFEPIVLKNSA